MLLLLFPNLLTIIIFLCFTSSVFSVSNSNPELESLVNLKSSLDPSNTYLSSWSHNGDPCDGTFEGVGCNENGQVANISLQGKGLKGQLSPAISGLKHLTGIYLHYNSLFGEIPKEISSLTHLVDLYLDVNNLSGVIPPQIGNMENLQVLQLCYNKLTGSIPTQLGSLKKLSVLALQSNNLTGAIPASLGEIETLLRLDLSFNHLFGSIPTPIAEAPLLESLDIRNNTLSGNVPPALLRLNEGFQYANNPGLCGVGFLTLKVCPDSDHIGQIRPEPYGGGVATSNGLPRKEIPETANVKLPDCNQTGCPNNARKSSHNASIAVGVVVVALAMSLISVFIFTKYRRTKQKLGSSFELSDTRLSTDQPREFGRKNGSPLISLEYPNGWDPLSDVRSFNGFSNDVIQGFRFNLEEVECATQYFSPSNLLGKSGLSAVFRGVLRDGSVVAVKRISKSSCKSEEAEFLKGLNVLTSLTHENLVRLRGFCCSRGRGECFLVYDFVSNGNLLSYLDLKDGDASVLEWSTRVWIIHGIAKGIQYLHSSKVNKPLVHQNISAEKVLIDQRFNPMLADSGLYKLLTNDTVFSTLKASAAMGYLAPEYTTTGKFTELSDVYAFGMVVFQVLSGRRKITNSIRVGAESLRSQEFVDPNLHGRFSEFEAAKLAKIALNCTLELPNERPSMDAIILDLGSCTNCYRSP